jgi:predicted RNA-binding Zn ribbon-like protein
MLGDSKECQKLARRCTELAADTADPDVKKCITELAAVWTQLVIDYDNPRTRRGPNAGRLKWWFAWRSNLRSRRRYG